MHSRTMTSIRNHGHVAGQTVAEVLQAVGITDEVDAPLAGPAVG
jgi:hypothetical protein